METVVCNLCHQNDARLFYRLPDYLLSRDEVVTTLVRCQHCGLVYQNPRTEIAEMGAHYPPEYESYNPASDKQNTLWLIKQAIEYGLEKRSQFVFKHRPAGSLLDIGCATGVFLNKAGERQGWEVQGVEISPHAARIARERYNLKVFTGTLEEAEFPACSFDAVTMWDVFEHLHDPQGSLKEINRVLKPNGVLVLRVPNLDSWDAWIFGRYWAGLDAPRHLYVFNHDTLSRMLEANGFQLLELSTRGGSYLTFALSVRFWLTARGAQPDTVKSVYRLLTHPALRLITAPLFYLRDFGLHGPLLTITAEKTDLQK